MQDQVYSDSLSTPELDEDELVGDQSLLEVLVEPGNPAGMNLGGQQEDDEGQNNNVENDTELENDVPDLFAYTCVHPGANLSLVRVTVLSLSANTFVMQMFTKLHLHPKLQRAVERFCEHLAGYRLHKLAVRYVHVCICCLFSCLPTNTYYQVF